MPRVGRPGVGGPLKKSFMAGFGAGVSCPGSPACSGEGALANKYLRDPIHGSIGFDKDRAKGVFDALLAAGQIPRKGRALERTRLVAIAAALLHDVGHGPFSHLYEKVFNDRKHEEWTRLIIRNARGEAGRLLRRAGLVEEVLAVYDRAYRPTFVSDIVSSQLDADRLDYLLRDSFMTGVAYGQYDLEWILTNLRLARRGRPGAGKDSDLRLAINGTKGYHAAEQFVIGRYLMYQQVYYH